MSNHSFNATVVPTLQPDPARPGSTTDPDDPVTGAIRPRRPEPETGFALLRPSSPPDAPQHEDAAIPADQGPP